MKVLSSDKHESETLLGLRQFFRLNLGRWTEFYQKNTIYAWIYQERHATAVRYAGSLKLPAGSFVLDAGCGPGFTSIALAQGGYVVHPMDFLREMAAATCELGRNASVGHHVRPTVGDVTRLPFANEVFDLVVMLGVTEWVPPLDSLVSEAARVLKPGGYLIIAWNNRWGLHLILDPVANPLLGRLRRFVRGVLERRGWIVPQPRGYLYSCKNFETAFRNHRLAILRARGIGFGPLSMMGLHLPETFGHKLNSCLQKAADTRMPFLQSVARDYVAVACKVKTQRPRSQQE